MENKDLRALILSAGQINNELTKIFGKIPSGLIPINGKPVIFRIIDKLLEVRLNIKPEAPEFGIKPVNLEEKEVEMLIEKS